MCSSKLARTGGAAAWAGVLSGAAVSVLLTSAPANAACEATGSVTEVSCSSSSIDYRVSAGSATLTLTDVVSSYVYFTPNTATGATDLTLTIQGRSSISNSGYSAVYNDSTVADGNFFLFIGEGVSINSEGSFGTVWIRNSNSGNIVIENNGTVTASPYGSDTEVPGITATSNDGTVLIWNNGLVTSADGRGIYADGRGDNSTGVSVGVTNTGTVNAYLAGIRVVDYMGTGQITNSGTVTSDTLQGMIVWAPDGGASISNAGTVIARDYVGIQAWSVNGDAYVVNSGTIVSSDDTSHTDSGSAGHDGIDARAQTSGDITIINSASGQIDAADGYGIQALADAGNISISNAGLIAGLDGISASAPNGSVSIENSGRITGSRYGVVLEGSGNTLVNTGSISGGTASVLFQDGGNFLDVAQGSIFDGVVDYNFTTGNTTRFGAGSYHLPAANYVSGGNTITLNNGSQRVVLNNADTSGSIDVVETSSVSKIASQYTDSVSSVVSSILSLDVSRPDVAVSGPGGQLLSYAEERKSEGQKAIAAMNGSQMVDDDGNLLWVRVFGGRRIQSASADAAASRIDHYGIIAGADRVVSFGRAGVFAGAGRVDANTSDSASSLEGTTGFFGLYGATKAGILDFNGSLTAGGISNESTRNINAGSETAEGIFSGWYVSPEISASHAFDLTPAWSLTPSARLRYVAAFYDGYSEKGSSQDLSYDSRTTESIEGRLQVELGYRYLMPNERFVRFGLSGAVLDSYDLRGSGFQARLSGSEFTFTDSADRNVFGGSLGGSFDVEVSRRVNIYGSFEASRFSDDSSSYVGRLGLKSVF